MIKINDKNSLLAASRIRYEITSGNIGGAFAVKNMTGAIYVAGALDYETRKRVSFQLQLNLMVKRVQWDVQRFNWDSYSRDNCI